MKNAKSLRRPVRHFFLKKGMQYNILSTIIFITIIASIVTTAIISLVYHIKSRGGTFYYMSNDIMQDLELTSILGIVVPALISAQIVTLVIAVFIGLFSSRKAAVPVYKLEKWALQLKRGKLKTHLEFREANFMKDLTIQCNSLAETYRQIFSDIENYTNAIIEDNSEKSLTIQKNIAFIKQKLEQLDYK